MKILWHSNALFAPTGYGNQTGLFCPRLQMLDGHEVVNSAFFGLKGARLNGMGGVRMLPCVEDDYGRGILAAHAKAEQVDLVVTLMDVWVLDPEMMAGLPWLAWVPIDHDPLPPAVKGMLERARWPVAYSKFGHKAMVDVGLDARYVPHGIDTKCFHPVEDRQEARESLIKCINNQHDEPMADEDTFIVVMVAANKGLPSRKAFFEVMQAWAEFSAGHPNVHLYLHTEKFGVQGVPFETVIELVGVDPETITFAPQYEYATGGIGPSFLNTVYNAADVFLNPAYGEGFGLPTVEAQAAGCPVIVGDNTAQKELCFSGWKVDGLKHITPQISYQWMPYVGSVAVGLPVYGIVDALEDALAWQGDKDMRAAARKGAEAYDVDLVVSTYWEPLLNEISEEIESGKRQAARVAARFGGKGYSEKKLPQVKAWKKNLAKYVAFYDDIAVRDAAMERHVGDAWYNEHRMMVAKSLIDTLDFDEDSIVVDLGCAEGQLLSMFTWNCVGVDISQKRVQRAVMQYPDNNFEIGDACTFGEIKAYDLVIATELIEHVLDPEALLKNMFRICKRGGYALIATPNDPAGEMVDGLEHLRGYGPDAFAKAVEAVGFRIVARNSTAPGIFGQDGLLGDPEKLEAYKQMLDDGDWQYVDGSNLFLLVQRNTGLDDKRKKRREKKAAKWLSVEALKGDGGVVPQTGIDSLDERGIEVIPMDEVVALNDPVVVETNS